MLRTVGPAAAALTSSMVPIFLLGALSEDIRRDLGLGEMAIGAIVTVVFLVAAVAAAPAGRISERHGAGVTLRTGVVLAGLVGAAVAAFAQGWLTLLLPLAFVGVAVGLVDTGAARAFADRVSAAQHGQAFGLKEASVPTASLLAGLAVPVVAATWTWRHAFAAGAVVAGLVLLTLRGIGTRRAGTVAPPVEELAGEPGSKITSVTLGLAVGAGLGAGAATSAATFLVPGLQAQGLTPTVAGLVLAAASVASIATRILIGRWADRPDADALAAVLAMCVVGCLGTVVLAAAVHPLVAAVAAMLMLGGGWGWTGLAFLAAVRANPRAPATAAGVVLSGLGFGSALGPLTFGTLASRVSYAAAWLLVAAGLAAAALTVFLVRRQVLPAGSAPAG